MAGSFAETTRWKLRRLLGTSKVSDVDEGFQRLAEDVDTTMVGLLVDTFAKRPAAGTPNRIFRASDTGVYYLDNGTVWRALGVGSWGQIGSGGGIEQGSGDFTVAKLATGEYEIKWSTARPSAAYVAVASVVGPVAGTAVVATGGTTRFFVETFTPGGTAADHIFSFIVIGAS